MEEHAIIKMGLDSNGVETGLLKMRHSFEHTVNGIKNSFINIGHHLAGSFTATGVIMTLENAMERVQAIKRVSENLGASTDFVQNMQNLGRATGISGEAMEKMLNKFIQGLPAGSDLEEEFYRLADRLKEIEDPATRAQMAFEAFGKSGVKIISIAKNGSEAIGELGDSWAKFSGQDIDSIEEAKLAMEKSENFFQVWLARAGIGVGRLAKATLRGGAGNIPGMVMDLIGQGISGGDELSAKKEEERLVEQARAASKYSAEMAKTYKALEAYHEKMKSIEFAEADVATKIKMLQEEKLEAQSKVTDDITTQYDFMMKVMDVDKQITDLKKKQTEEVQKQQIAQSELINRQLISANNASDALEDSKHRRLEFSLGELAGPGRWEAGQAMQLQKWAQWNVRHGFIGLAEQQMGRADELQAIIRKVNPYLEDPQQHLVRESEKQNKLLSELVHAASAEGLVVRPRLDE